MVVEEIITALKKNNVEIINLKYDEVTGKMKLHRLKYTTCVRTTKINMLECVDDGSFVFNYRSGLTLGIRIIKEIMAK